MVNTQNLKYLIYTAFVYGLYDGRTDIGQRKIEFRRMNETLKSIVVFCGCV